MPSLPPGGRGTTKWWKEPAEVFGLHEGIFLSFYAHARRSPSVASGAGRLRLHSPEGAFFRCHPLYCSSLHFLLFIGIAFSQPRDYRVVFVIQKNGAPTVLRFFYLISCSNASNSGVLKNSPRVISKPSHNFLIVMVPGF